MDTPPLFDRHSPLREDLDVLERMLQDASNCLLPLYKGQILVRESDPHTLCLPQVTDGADLLELNGELVFLGKHDDRGYFAIDISELDDPQRLPGITETYVTRDLRIAGASLSALDAHLAAYGRGMLHFHQISRYCGRCGGETRPRKGGHTRRCQSCQHEWFPRLEPAVLVLIEYEGRFLLGRQSGFPKGMYSALAGFVEPGESLEAAVHREVFEEVGLKLSSLRYAGSQPWPFPASLMLGYHATATHDRVVLDHDELQDARFFTREELAKPTIPGFFTPPPFALAGQLLAEALVQGA